MPPTTDISEILYRMMALTAYANLQECDVSQELGRLQRALQQQVDNRCARFELERRALAHEVNNALTGILSCAEILATCELDWEERQDFLGVIGKEIDRVLAMSREFADTLCASAQVASLETITISAFMQDLLPLITAYLSRRRVCFRHDLQYTGPMQAHVGQLKQVFLNLIYNACEAMPEGGIFNFSSHLIWEHDRSRSPQRREPLIEFSLTDTGCGIPEEVRSHLFEPYMTSGKAAGTGLGLAIVKKILDTHHARIHMESRVGQGTTIQILFPCIQ